MNFFRFCTWAALFGLNLYGCISFFNYWNVIGAALSFLLAADTLISAYRKALK